ncbi:MAG: hypothetical protein ACI857_003197 [Arenicella sp.]|jgi:hypothetical protein
MITEKLYTDIAKEYGRVASWAVWEKAGDKPKSNISNMDIFNIEKNNSLLNILRTDVVMVALNFARDVEISEPFLNFHDANPHGQDFKIRYAFEGTEFYGAYMTDIIKDFPMLSSKDVLIHLSKHPDMISSQVEVFKKELNFIDANKPTVLAFGKDTYNILKKYLDGSDYSKLIGLTYYSHQISKENYQIDTHQKLGIKI